MVKIISNLVALAIIGVAFCGLTSASTLSFDHYWTYDEVCDFNVEYKLGLELLLKVTERMSVRVSLWWTLFHIFVLLKLSTER